MGLEEKKVPWVKDVLGYQKDKKEVTLVSGFQ